LKAFGLKSRDALRRIHGSGTDAERASAGLSRLVDELIGVLDALLR